MSDARTVAVALFVCLAASVVEFSTTADICNILDTCSEKKYAWALACGVISTFLCIVGLVLTRVMPGRPAAVDLVFAVLLTGLWVFGASFNTSAKGIFGGTGNGYFSTWTALLAAAYYAHLSLGHIRERIEQHARVDGPVLVLVASIVEMASAADYYTNGDTSADNQHSDRTKWAIAVGAVSSFLCIIQLLLSYLHLSVAETSGKALGLFLVALWAAGAGVNTSAKGPFPSTGNGYFSSWMAFATSILFAISALGGPGTTYSDDTRPYAPAPAGGSSGAGPVVGDAPPVGAGSGYQTLGE